jgi:uncharacterized protein (TIGR03546 family)
VNKGLALVAAIVFSFMAPGLDEFSHKLGAAILTTPALQAVYAAVYSLPLGPWLGFQNTVVTGSFAIGLYVAYPVYWVVRMVCEYLEPAKASSAYKRLAMRGTI